MCNGWRRYKDEGCNIWVRRSGMLPFTSREIKDIKAALALAEDADHRLIVTCGKEYSKAVEDYHAAWERISEIQERVLKREAA